MNQQNTKKINLALIGASNIAARILPSIRKVSALNVMGVAAQRNGTARAFAETHTIQKHYSRYEDALNDPDIDAVYISTLNSDHACRIKAALLAKKHVLCEKPLVLNATEAEEMFSMANRLSLVLLEGFMYRYHPQIQRLHEIIKDGTIGEIQSIRCHYSFLLYNLKEERPHRASSQAGGGALHDLGCYAVDFINTLLKSTPLTRVKTFIKTNSADPNFDLSTIAILEFQNGIKATLSAAVDSPSLNIWEVSGNKGSVSALRYNPMGSTSVPLYVVNEESEATLIKCDSVDLFYLEFKNFADAILGLAKPNVSPSASIQNAKLLEAIRTSRVDSLSLPHHPADK